MYFKSAKSKKESKKDSKISKKKYLGDDLFLLKTIFGAEELNFCVRDGNRCTLFAIVTKENIFKK